MKAVSPGMTILIFGAILVGCTRSQAPSPSVDPSAGRSPAAVHATGSVASVPTSTSTSTSTPTPTPAPRATTAATPDACAACKGEWGRHGIAETESCNCRTMDKGKVCRDGRDCSGECIADPALFEVVEPGPPVRGRYRGRCSEFVTVFGCNPLLLDGARGAPLVPKGQEPEVLCVD